MYRTTKIPVLTHPTQAEPEDISPAHYYRPSNSGEGTRWPEGNRLLVFCDIVLKHAGYPHAFLKQSQSKEEEEESSDDIKSIILVKNERVSSSPLNSVGESGVDSMQSSSSISESEIADLENGDEDEEYDKETYESVTCWCGQPYAGRPMIECDMCLVWFHMICEEVVESKIPELFHCRSCRTKKRRKRPSASNKRGKNKRRRSSTTTSPASISTITSESVQPLHSSRTNGSVTLPSPLRLDEAVTTSNSASYSNGLSATLTEPSSSNPQPGTSSSFYSTPNPNPPKKRGRKKSANATGTNPTAASSTSILSARLGLSLVNVGSPRNDIGHQPPPPLSQPPPLLPCYAVGSTSTPVTPDAQRLVHGYYASLNGDINGLPSPSPTAFPPPVLEPQVNSDHQQPRAFFSGEDREL